MDGFEFNDVDRDKSWRLDNCADETAAHQLCNLMSNLSEDHYCAGWLSGLEFGLFDAAYAGERDAFGFGITHKDVSQLITLSQQCQGWWIWDTEHRFVSFDEWFSLYSEHYRLR